jgi:phosphoglycolate phosphatase
MGDYKATKEAGLPFIHAAYGFGEVPDADYVVNAPLDLLNIL